MNDSIILIFSVLVSLGLGTYIGISFSKLKSKSDQSTLEERQNQLNQTISSLKENLNKTENEREEIRKEINKVEWLKKSEDLTLYGTGGSFRALGSAYIKNYNYPKFK